MSKYVILPGRRVKKNTLPDNHFISCLKEENNPKLIYSQDRQNIYGNNKIKDLIDDHNYTFEEAIEKIEQSDWGEDTKLELTSFTTPKGNSYLILELASLVAQIPCGSNPSRS